MSMHMAAMQASNNALVLREKAINTEGPCYVRLVGRKKGFTAWLLTILGIDVTTTLEVYADRIEHSYGSLSGFIHQTIPMANVSNIIYGYFKPAVLMIFGMIAAVLGLISLIANPIMGIFVLIVAAIFFVMYWLKKTSVIMIIPNSAVGVDAAFKRSVIENQNISTEDAQNIVAILNQLVAQAGK